MKTISKVLFLSVLTLIFLTIGCGDKYSDVKKVNEEYIVLVESYIVSLDKADNAKDVAKAINKFADGMQNLMPEMQKLSEKYPELDDQSNPSEELKEIQEKTQEVGQKMAGAMMKLMPYMTDPEVLNAQGHLVEVMQKK